MSQKFKSLRESSVLSPVMSEYPADVVKAGPLKKLKKMKRKFFVLRKGCRDCPSKLEYYPSEKKWRLGCEPKRSILLKSCFNISRKLHPKHKFVICLYTTTECFSVVLETEEEMNEWLSALLELQLNEVDCDEENKTRPAFEHVWQVVVDDRELEFSKSLSGPYCLGLTSKALSLVRISSLSENFECLDFPLMSIRRCGHSGKHFFIELGRSAVTGAGGIWMETEGTIVAQNMHETILGAMKSSRNKEDLGPHSRPRSASTSENSKPIATRRPVGVVLPQPTLNSSLTSSRERCNTIPPRAQTISESLQDAAYSLVSGSDSLGRQYYCENSRPHSVYAWPSSSSPTLSTFGSLSASVCTNSSISFDDHESPPQSHLSWYTYGHSGDETFMMENSISEAPNEYLMMSPTDDNMNIIPMKSDYLNMNPSNSQTNVYGDVSRRSEPIVISPQKSQPSDYMDMRSPSSSEGYIPMSRIGSVTAEATKRPSSNSLCESVGKGDDGYVPMAPCGASEEVSVSIHDGYLSMSPLSSSLPKRSSSGVFSHSSFNGSNATSEDDSSEFKLDKVQSLVKESDEDMDHDFIKPVRAYSIGNRKQIYEARARAYSMGSERARPDIEVNSDTQTGSLKDANCAAKSCSAPILQESPSVSHKTSFETVQECSGDLMEINYHKKDDRGSQSGHDSDVSNKKPLPKSRQRTTSRSSASMLPLLSLNEVSERGGLENSNSVKQVTNQSISLGKAHADVEPEDSSNYMPMNHGSESQSIGKNKANPACSSAAYGAASVQKANCSSSPKGSSCMTLPEDAQNVPMALSPAICESMESVEKKRNLDLKTAQTTALMFPKSLFVANTLKVENSVTRQNRNPHNSSHVLEVKGGISSQGEYVNLMLNKPSHTVTSSLDTSPKMDSSKISSSGDAGSLDICPSSEPDYMNIKLGKPFTPLPNPALVSSTNSQPSFTECCKENGSQSPGNNSVHKEIHLRRSPVIETSTPSGSAKSTTTPKSFAFSSLPPIKKQMSAPAVPPSLQPEIVSPGRKSSCPVTGSSSMVRSSGISPATSTRLTCLSSVGNASAFFKAAPSCSPDHNSTVQADTSVSPKLRHPSLTSQQCVTESQYENVNLSSSSRPGSVSSEKELNYASLDLAPTTSGEAPHSPSLLKLSHQSAVDDEPLTYAEIDFTKSEGLRHTSGTIREGRL